MSVLNWKSLFHENSNENFMSTECMQTLHLHLPIKVHGQDWFSGSLVSISYHMPDWKIYSFNVSRLLRVHRNQFSDKSRKENPQKLTQLSSRSHPRYLVGKRTAQKDTIIDITSDSQVNSNFLYRWSPASLTFKRLLHCFFHFFQIFS